MQKLTCKIQWRGQEEPGAQAPPNPLDKT